MYKVLLVAPPILPVPSVKGGAIESLIDILIAENEKAKLLDLNVISTSDKKAKLKSKEISRTKFFYIKQRLFFQKIINALNKLCFIVTKKKKVYSNYYSKVLQNIKRNSYDLVIAEGGQYEQFKSISKTIGKEKLVLHIHHHLKCNSAISNIFGHTISVSKFISEEWKKTNQFDTNDYVLYNSIDESKFNICVDHSKIVKIKNELKIQNDDFVILYCGRIIPEKGVLELIETFTEMNQSNMKLLIIGGINFANGGTSEYYKRVTELIKKNENILYVGYVPNTELITYYKIVDIQVVPSLWEEAAGLVLIEAMKNGIPSIITNSGGMIEYTNENCSIIVNRKNFHNEIKLAIDKIYSNTELYSSMKLESLENSKKYSSKKFYNNFIEIVKDIKMN